MLGLVSDLANLVVSFLLLILASWCVGEGGEILGEKYDASVVGGLIIAWLNTAPETIFFVTALNGNQPHFAIGALSGSVIVVSSVALGSCIVLGARARKTGTISIQPAIADQSLILVCSLAVLLQSIMFGFTFATGLFGIAEYFAFLVYSLRGGSEPSPESVLEAGRLSDSDSDDEAPGHEEPTWKGVAYLLAGGALIVYCSDDFIEAVANIANTWEVSPSLLAFFLAPIASEAPEILESVQLSRKGNTQNINIAFSNLVGGTITKTTLLFGMFNIFGVLKQYAWNSPNYTVSILLLALTAGCAGLAGSLQRRVPASYGYGLYAVFCFTGIVQYFVMTTYV